MMVVLLRLFIVPRIARLTSAICLLMFKTSGLLLVELKSSLFFSYDITNKSVTNLFNSGSTIPITEGVTISL